MWFRDIGLAWQAIREFKNEERNLDFYVSSVRPAVDGIVFRTTYHTYIKWFYDGRVEETPVGAGDQPERAE